MVSKELQDTINLMTKVKNLAREHIKLVNAIDSRMKALGFDVEALRNSDDAGYVDMIDYGRGDFVLSEATKYREVSKKG